MTPNDIRRIVADTRKALAGDVAEIIIEPDGQVRFVLRKDEPPEDLSLIDFRK